MGASGLCPEELGARSVRVEPARRVASRLPGGDGGVKARIHISLRVVSDYLFIGSGKDTWTGLEEAAARLDISGLRGSGEHILRSLENFIAGMPAGLVKDFFRIRNPRTGRLEPAIPGSSLKGAARSRLELATRDTGRGSVVAGFLYDSGGVVTRLPPPGVHGWRHARIWCESLAEQRVIESSPTVGEELYGMARPELSLGSKALFSTLYPVGEVRCEVVELDHGETLCAVTRGAVFRGYVDAVNVSLEELGLLLYSLGLDKLLCGGEPRLLMGYSKYRCRRLARSGRRVSFGIVSVRLEGINEAPWSLNALRDCGAASTEIVKCLVERAVNAYPGLPRCFDEVSRRLALEKC